MGRPLAGFGFFNAEKRFDAETENFEKVKIHAFLEQELNHLLGLLILNIMLGIKLKMVQNIMFVKQQIHNHHF